MEELDSKNSLQFPKRHVVLFLSVYVKTKLWTRGLQICSPKKITSNDETCALHIQWAGNVADPPLLNKAKWSKIVGYISHFILKCTS